MVMGGYGNIYGGLNLNTTPMCDFNTWYQIYYPFYAQMANAQSNTATNASTVPNFRGTQMPSASQHQQHEESKKNGSGGKFAAVLSAAALIGGGIACYRKGSACGAKGFWGKLTKGFHTYKTKGIVKLSTHKYVKKGYVDTLPENTTFKTGTFAHNTGDNINYFTFADDKIVGYKNARGEDLLSKINNPLTEADRAYAETIKTAFADIRQGKAVDGFDVTPYSCTLYSDGKRQIYDLILEEGENHNKYRHRTRERKWFWQS